MGWSHEDVAEVATDMKAGLPLALHTLILSDEFKGGDLVQLSCELSRPAACEIALNHCWIRPFVKKFPDKVASGFFVADVFLRLDKMMKNKLLRPINPADTKITLAQTEANRIKKLTGALRYLWRSSIPTLYIHGPTGLNHFYVCCFFFKTFERNIQLIFPLSHRFCSGDGAHHPRVLELKSLLVKSPSRSRLHTEETLRDEDITVF